MLPVEWPIAAGAADLLVDPARAAGRDRLPIVRRDLFLDARARLSEQERALISAMLGALIDQLADEIRLGLPPEFLAHAEPDREHVTLRMWNSGALDRPALISLLMRRAGEQLIGAACRGGRGVDDIGTVERLVGDSDSAVASAAMGLSLARGRRRDRFGHLGVEYDDLPPAEAQSLVHLTAAAMRLGIVAASVTIDETLAAAAERVFARHHPQRRVEGRAHELAESLIAARGTDDVTIATLAAEGDAAMVAALCAVRAAIAPQTAWKLLVDDGASGAMLLARLAGLGRTTAATLVSVLAEPLLWGDPRDAIILFDRPSSFDVDSAGRWWRLPLAFRDGLIRPGGADGQSFD